MKNTTSLANPKRGIVLVDMDGVLCDWQGGFDAHMERLLPHVTPIDREEIKVFKTQSVYPVQHKREISAMLNTERYYADLLPIEGVKDGMNALAEKYDVFICTAPYVSNPTCASEKMEWVAKHLGSEWVSRVIITSDKTLVFGDVLIDDKPEISGVRTPNWDHVVFDAPYNRSMTPRIDRWADAVQVIDSIIG